MESTLTFLKTKDWPLIREVMTDPAIYPHIADDFSPPRDGFEPFKEDAIWYVKVLDDKELLGIFMFHPDNAICWQVHTCLLPHAWGARAKLAGRGVVRWIFANSQCQRIVTVVPAGNRLALKFAGECGMELYGCNPGSFMKDGKLVDQILLGISKAQ